MREQPERLFRRAPRQWRQRSTVVIADVRQGAPIVGKQPCGKGQTRGSRLQVGHDPVAGDARDGEREQIKVESVLVVMG
jgi:hypothetical protein